jgi:membrane protein implicated in regulation of membrane protease activity
MESPEVWRWIWLGAAAVLAAGELATATTFFLLPFAVGAALAAAAAFAGLVAGVQWILFVVVSAAAVAVLRPLARRLDTDKPADGIGARRWIGQPATVLAGIPPGVHETGLVRVGREEWRAQSVDGSPIPAGTPVRVVDLTGTRLVVWPVDRAALPGTAGGAAPTEPT